MYAQCEYCGGRKRQVSILGTVVCKGCGAEVKEVLCLYYGKPVTDFLDFLEISKSQEVFPEPPELDKKG